MIKLDVRRRFDPQMALAVAESQRLYADLPGAASEDVAAQRALYAHERAYWNAVKPALAKVEALSIPGPGGAIACRLYRPSEGGLLPAVVYFHGGGWILGNLDTHDRIMRLLAEKSGALVLGVDYRLAPEHKFPAAHDDALAATRHILTRGRSLGIDATRKGPEEGYTREWPEEMVMSKEVKESVARRWREYGLAEFVDIG